MKMKEIGPRGVHDAHLVPPTVRDTGIYALELFLTIAIMDNDEK